MTVGPRYAHEWEALAFVAGRMVDARADKADAPLWAAIAADWQWVLTHDGVPAFGKEQPARIKATAEAAGRALRDLASLGIADPDMLHAADRLTLPDLKAARLVKYELLAAIAWHEARLLYDPVFPEGRPMIALITEINIHCGRKPHGTGAVMVSVDAPPPAVPAAAAVSDRAGKIPPPTHHAPRRAPAPQQARLI